MWLTYGPPLNEWRRTLSLRPWESYLEMLQSRRSLEAPNLIAYSPSFAPKPHDWDETHRVTGYWYLDPPPGWAPSPELVRFLDAGSPPVLFGFGSMPGEGSPEDRTALILDALKISAQRGLILTGSGGALAQIPAPDTVMFISGVPYSWLLPRTAAVVHHGGGTTAAVVRAGVPGIVTPLIIDQHAWAERVVRQGIGLSPSTMAKLTQ